MQQSEPSLKPAASRGVGAVPVLIGLRQWSWIGGCTICLVCALLPLVHLSRLEAEVAAEPSAEIFFTHATGIAAWGEGGSLVFSFVIHNLAHRRHAYRYAVSVHRAGTTSAKVGSDAVTLGPDGARRIRWTLRQPPEGRFQVRISLPGTASSIHFWASHGSQDQDASRASKN